MGIIGNCGCKTPRPLVIGAAQTLICFECGKLVAEKPGNGDIMFFDEMRRRWADLERARGAFLSSARRVGLDLKPE